MGLKYYFEEMASVKNEIYRIQEGEFTSTKREAMKCIWVRIIYAIKLIFFEKELIAFALLQWICIALGYYLWVQIIGWMPEEVWERAIESEVDIIVDIVLLLWSFLCVGVIAFPIGILTACMGAVHFLHRQGKKSKIAACLQIVIPQAWPLWIFHWIDGWWTVNRILDRLPKKNDQRTFSEKALSEALYYAWKTGTIGILPSLVTGKSLINAGKDSISFVKHKYKDAITLRLGYSALCWIVGIASYIGAILFFVAFPDLVKWEQNVASQMFPIYFWLAVPIIVAVGVVMLFLRPIFVISACDIYSDFIKEKGETVILQKPPSKGMSALVIFLMVFLIVMIIFLYRQELGITNMLSR
jgi:hypothetical protein